MTLAPSRAGDRLASQDLGAHLTRAYLLGAHLLANTTAEIFPDTPTRDADTPASRRNLRSCVAATTTATTATATDKAGSRA